MKKYFIIEKKMVTRQQDGKERQAELCHPEQHSSCAVSTLGFVLHQAPLSQWDITLFWQKESPSDKVGVTISQDRRKVSQLIH